MNNKVNKIMYSMRIEREMLKKLDKIAKDKDRTTSNLIRLVLKNYLQSQDI